MKPLVHVLRGGALLALFALTFAGSTPTAAAADGQVTILYNGAVRAQLDDCGCPSRPLGGLARRALKLDELKAAHPEAILLDPGSLFGDPTTDTLAQSRFVAAETAKLGYEVIGVGPYELGHGVEAVRQVAASTGLNFISANVKRGGDLLFEPYRVIERNGVKVAVTSVFDPEYVGEPYMARAGDVEITDPVAAMKNWLPEMDAAADVVVVLANLKQSNNVTFLRQLQQGGHQEIDLVVDGIYDNAIKKPRRFGPTHMVAANSQGKHVGQATLTVQNGTVADFANEIHFLDLKLPEDADVASRVKSFVESQASVAGSK